MEQSGAAESERADSRVHSTASFMSMERASGAVEPNGAYAPGSPSKLSTELARRLAVADSNPPQPQATLALSVAGSGGLPPPHEFTFFCEPRHDEVPPAASAEQQGGAAAGRGSQAGGAGGALVAGGGGAGTGEGLVSK